MAETRVRIPVAVLPKPPKDRGFWRLRGPDCPVDESSPSRPACRESARRPFALVGAAVTVALSGSQPARRAPKATRRPAARTVTPSPPKPRGPFAVGLRVLRLVDHSRLIGAEPRTLVTVVRYPAVGAPSARDLPNAQPERAGGPFPLVVFAHGYRLAPYTYAQLLNAWAQAGYVVAAPAFPLTNADAPVVDRSDLINQPQDVRFVISRLASAAPRAACHC